ncbi:MAG: hypothetical protein JNM98_01245 [Rhodocyclaceae bacterium]|nr:hypothetical protein [Rhodocyclaceae bacterium]
MNPANKRFIAIFLVLAAPLAAWLVYAFLVQTDHQTAKSGDVAKSEAPVPAPAVAATPGAAAAPAQARYAEAAAPPAHAYKCRSAAGTRYSGEPCTAGERQQILRLPAHAAPAPAERPVLLQPAAANAHAPRAVPDLRSDTASTGSVAALITAQASTDAVDCVQIDARIAAIDALTRQPHGAREADVWRAERRRLTDLRYSLHCSG